MELRAFVSNVSWVDADLPSEGERDFITTAPQAKEYGIVDDIIDRLRT